MKFKIKLISLVTLSLLLVYILLPWNQFKTVYAKNDGDSSTIAGINVTGLEREQIQTALQDAINTWVSLPITIFSDDTQIDFDPSVFQFDVDATISQYETLVEKPWYAFWESEKVVHIPLELTVPEEIKNELSLIRAWSTDETYNALITNASYLKEHDIQAVVKDLTPYENERLALSIEDVPENVLGVSALIEELNDRLIHPGEEFSFIESIGTSGEFANVAASHFVASMLYDTALQAGYEITERHPQKDIPIYLEAGKDAAINLAFKEDLKFVNNTKGVGLIKATLEGTSLMVEIYSDLREKDAYVSIDQERISPRVIYRYTNDLAIGQEELLQEGEQGLRVNVFRTINANGVITEEHVSRDYYAPVNRIILKSSREPESTNDTTVEPSTDTSTDSDLDIDMDGNGLPDTDLEKPLDDDELPPGSYYDKGGNLVTP